MAANYDWKAVRDNLKSRMRASRLTAEELSYKSGINRKTIDNFLQKKSNLRVNTLRKIEETLSVDLTSGQTRLASRSMEIAPVNYGSYSRNIASAYIGQYYLFRRSFDYDDGCVCSYLKISWHDDMDHMTFQEVQKNKSRKGRIHHYDLSGFITIPHGLSLIHI